MMATEIAQLLDVDVNKQPDHHQEPSVFIQFADTNGEETGSPIFVPCNSSTSALTEILSTFREKEENDAEMYEFYIGETQILDDLKTAISQFRAASKWNKSEAKEEQDNKEPIADALESVVTVTFQAQAVFRVRPVTRCTSTLPGHKGAVLAALFSPDARALATGSGDCTVRFWDLNTELPRMAPTSGHHGPILCLAWSPDGLRLASGCQSGFICLWRQKDGMGTWELDAPSPLIQPSLSRTPANSKARWIRSIAWRPFHLDKDCRLLAVAYQETSIVIWDTVTGKPHRILSGHEKPVTSLRWGGTDLIYSSSQDRTIRVWRSGDGILCKKLDMHGHWVNCLALSVDYVLRTGPFDPADAVIVKTMPLTGESDDKKKLMQQRAKLLYEKVKGNQPERLVAGSDDNTLSLWEPEASKKPLCPRMVGHQGVVNDVKFSPDARLIASASFDHSVKIWDGLTGQFLATMFGHVQDVYLVAWSSDSRLLCSGSKDSTLKLWSLTDVRRWKQEAAVTAKKGGGKVHQRRRHILHDLPGHADAVYALDWSPDGQRVASGGKDRVLKLWRA